MTTPRQARTNPTTPLFSVGVGLLVVALIFGFWPHSASDNTLHSCGSPLVHGNTASEDAAACQWAVGGAEQWMWICIFLGGLVTAVALLLWGKRQADK